MKYINNKFEQNYNMSRDRNESPKLFDHLESLYNEEARQQQSMNKNQKQLYFKLIQAQNYHKLQQKAHYDNLNKIENQKIQQFWKNEEEKRRQAERKRKQMIDETRKINMQQSKQLGKSQMYNPQKSPKDNYGQYLQYMKERRKMEKQTYLLQNNYYADLRKIAEKNQKINDITLYKAKQEEQRLFNIRREAQLKRLRDKHQQDIQCYKELDGVLKQKQMEKAMLEDYVVRQGAQDIQSRMMQHSQMHEEAVKNLKNKFISQLKSQVQHDEVRPREEKRKIITQQRLKIDQKNRYLQELDQIRKSQKIEENKRHLEQLKGQVRPRSLIPQKDIIEDAGIGSPVHIGKIFNEDRRKQMEWLQKSLQKELSIK